MSEQQWYCPRCGILKDENPMFSEYKQCWVHWCWDDVTTPVKKVSSLPTFVIKLQAENAELLALLYRYRHKTPLGHQPHMIAHEADEALQAAGYGETGK